jgi:hypothetical protein
LLQLVGQREVPHCRLNPARNPDVRADANHQLEQLLTLLVTQIGRQPPLALVCDGEGALEQLTTRRRQAQRPGPRAEGQMLIGSAPRAASGEWPPVRTTG